jgi:hypothetical protein
VVSAQVLIVGIFLAFADFDGGDMLPWIWLVQQVVTTFAWIVRRGFLFGYFADTGRTEQLLGDALSSKADGIRAKAVLLGKGSLGIEASLVAEVVDGRE